MISDWIDRVLFKNKRRMKLNQEENWLLIPLHELELSQENIRKLVKLYRFLTKTHDAEVLTPVEGCSRKKGQRAQFIQSRKPLSEKKLCSRTERVAIRLDFVF